MSNLRQPHSLRRRLGLAMGGLTIGSVVLAGLVLAAYELSIVSDRAAQQLEGLGESLSATLEAPVDFRNPEDAALVLRSLARIDDIVDAQVILPDGSVFARYIRRGEGAVLPDVRAPGIHERDGNLVLVRELGAPGSVVGLLVLRSDLGSEWERFRRGLFILGILGVVMALVAAAVSAIVQRSITDPIRRLAETAGQITATSNFSLRAHTPARDEIGTLAQSFNHMLDALGRNEAALRRSEERLRFALDAASMGTWMWEILENRVTWSDHIEVIFGLAPGAFRGTYDAYIELVPPEEREKVQAAVAAVLAAPDTDYHIQHLIIWPDGSSHMLEARGRVFCDLAGKPLRMAGTVVDVTEVRRAADAWQALHRATAAVGEAFFRSLARELGTVLAADFVFVGTLLPGGMRVRTVALWEKGQFAENVEYDLVGTPCANTMASGVCFIDDRLQESFSEDKLLVTLGVHSYYGVVLRGAAGQPIGLLVVLHSRPLADANMARSLIAVLAGRAGSELERLQTERALSETQARVRGVGDNLPNGFIFQMARDAREHRRFSYVSANIERMLGVTADQVLADPEALLGRIADEDRPRFVEAESKSWNTCSVMNAEVRMRGVDGGDRWLQVTASPRSLPGGDLVFDGVYIDITDRRRTEAELRQSQKMDSIGQLAGGVAHDFNNMLQAIMGFAQMAGDPTVGAGERDECLTEITAAAARAGDITRQLLLFSRQQPVQKGELEVGELVERLMKFIRRLLGETVELAHAPAPEPVWITADRTQVEQVLINLCINARDAMNGVGRIDLAHRAVEFDADFVARHPWARAGRFAELVIRDNGCGMDATTLGRIFEPFFTTKPKDRGTGLGLSVVYGIIRSHGGLVDVASTPGQGTVFRICFPLSESQPPAPAVPGDRSEERGVGTILLAEDEPSVRSMVERLLVRAGYTVLVACDGEDAVNLFQQHRERIDMLLLDAVMPRASGVEAFNRINALRPGIPVLFCSGYSEELATRAGALPAHARLLQKPYALEDLLAAVREAMNGKRRTG